MGLAAVVLRGRQLAWQDVLAFGVGIGAFEILWIIGMAAFELRAAESFAWSDLLAIGNAGFLAERAVTLVGHASSRVLVYAALQQGSLAVAIIAVSLFTLVDSAAVYGLLAGWDWEAPGVHTRFLAFLVVVGDIEGAAAWHFARPVLMAPAAPDDANAVTKVSDGRG